MEAEALDTTSAAQGLFILSAIPVVLFALWGQYFCEYIERLRQDTPDFKPDNESEKARLTVLFVILFELTLFLGFPEVRKAYPTYAQLVFVGAVTLLLLALSHIEKKIGAHKKGADDGMGILARAVLFWTGGTLLYVGILVGAIQLAGITADYLHAPPNVATAAMIVAGLIGVISGILLNFGLSPFIFKRILPTTLLNDGVLEKQFESIFARAHTHSTKIASRVWPKVWIVELEKIKLSSLVITGFQSGRGIFQPGLFISRWVLKHLTPSELEAITLNQMSHSALKHMRSRFLLSFWLIFVTAVACLASVWMGSRVFSNQVAFEILGPSVALSSFFVSFQILGNQTKKHILEADIYTIEKFGVSMETFTSALKKLDVYPLPPRSAESFDLGDEIIEDEEDISPNDFTFISQIHPETEFRIQLIKANLQPTPVQPEAEESEQAKAS